MYNGRLWHHPLQGWRGNYRNLTYSSNSILSFLDHESYTLITPIISQTLLEIFQLSHNYRFLELEEKLTNLTFKTEALSMPCLIIGYLISGFCQMTKRVFIVG